MISSQGAVRSLKLPCFQKVTRQTNFDPGHVCIKCLSYRHTAAFGPCIEIECGGVSRLPRILTSTPNVFLISSGSSPFKGLVLKSGVVSIARGALSTKVSQPGGSVGSSQSRMDGGKPSSRSFIHI